MKKILLVIAVVIGALACQSAMAQNVTTSAGLGVGIAPDYEGSEDTEAIPLLHALVTWDDGDYVLLNGNKLKWNLINNIIEFGPLLQYRPKRDDVDNDKIDGLKKIDAATEAGLFLTGVFDHWRATVEFAADISDEHDGYLLTLGSDYSLKIRDDLKMKFGAFTTFASDDYMETYFQIDSGNRGISTLPDYKSDDAELKDFGINFSVDYSINANWSILGLFSYKILLGDAKDSPIVDDEGDKNQMFLGAMTICHF